MYSPQIFYVHLFLRETQNFLKAMVTIRWRDVVAGVSVIEGEINRMHQAGLADMTHLERGSPAVTIKASILSATFD